MDATASSSSGYGKPAMVEKARPDFLIKYEPASGPAASEWTEEPVMGGQEEAAQRMKHLKALFEASDDGEGLVVTDDVQR